MGTGGWGGVGAERETEREGEREEVEKKKKRSRKAQRRTEVGTNARRAKRMPLLSSLNPASFSDSRTLGAWSVPPLS